MTATAASDAELLATAREGDESAFTELYVRHHGSAHRLAVSYRRAGDPDDLVNGAFERVLGALRRGAGPTDSFRAYLFVTLRRIAADNLARSKDDPYDEVPEPVAAEEENAPLEAGEREIVLSAYEALPDRWQAVLWQTTVEGKSPREVAPDLGMTANATAALAYRAREKFRQSYLQAHLQASTPPPRCQPFREKLGAYVRDGLSARDKTKVRNHLEDCTPCTSLEGELVAINSMLSRAVLPYFALASADLAAVAAVGGTGAGLVAGAAPVRFLRQGMGKVRNNPGPAAGAAAVVVAAALAMSMIGNDGEEPPATAAGPAEEVAAPPASSDPPADEPEPDDPAPEPSPDEPDPEPEPDEAEPDAAEPEAPTPASDPGEAEPDAPAPDPAPEPDTTSPPTTPVPTTAPPTTPAPTTTVAPTTTAPPEEPEPEGQVFWNPGAEAVEVHLANTSDSPTGAVFMTMEFDGTRTAGWPQGCVGVATPTWASCIVPVIGPGETVVVSQPVSGAGPGTFATVRCALEPVGRRCQEVLTGGTIELN